MKCKRFLVVLLAYLGLTCSSLIPNLPVSAQEPKLRATLKGHTNWVFSVAISGDGKLVASGSRDKTIRLWDVASGRETAILKGNTGSVHCVAFSPDGKTLASAAGGVLDSRGINWLIVGGEIKLWNVASGKEEASLQGHQKLAGSLAFSPDGKTLASGSDDNCIKLWDLVGRKEKATLTMPGQVSSVAFSPDGNTLAGGSGETIKLWDVASGKENAALMGNHRLWSVTFSPDGKTLASADDIKLWDVASGKEKVSLKGHTYTVASVAFTPDGKTLASGGFDGVKLWDVASARVKATLLEDFTVVSVTFSRDGKTLVTGCLGNSTVKLWDMPTDK